MRKQITKDVKRQWIRMEHVCYRRDIDPALQNLFIEWQERHENERVESKEKTFPRYKIPRDKTSSEKDVYVTPDYESFANSFCPDGFTSINGYYQKKTPKIEVLFVLKEAHLEPDGDNLISETNNTFWFNRPCPDKITDIYHKRIRDTFSPLMKYCHFNDPLNDSTPFGYMNINKRGGAGTTDMTRLSNYADYYGDLISRQIQIMNPRIIVCFGCYGVIKNIRNTRRADWNKLRLESIIDLYHPKYSRFEERILYFKKQMHPELE